VSAGPEREIPSPVHDSSVLLLLDPYIPDTRVRYNNRTTDRHLKVYFKHGMWSLKQLRVCARRMRSSAAQAHAPQTRVAAIALRFSRTDTRIMRIVDERHNVLHYRQLSDLKPNYKYKLSGLRGGSVETAKFWVVTKFSLVYSNQQLRGICWLILHILRILPWSCNQYVVTKLW
jgi:hypothetical protein